MLFKINKLINDLNNFNKIIQKTNIVLILFYELTLFIVLISSNKIKLVIILIIFCRKIIFRK